MPDEPQTTPAPAPAPAPAPPRTPSAPQTQAAPEALGSGYHTKEWNGVTFYECDGCPFDSSNEKKVAEHAALHADAPAPTVQPDTQTRG